MSFERCPECKKVLVVRRERIALWTQTDYYKVKGSIVGLDFKLINTGTEREPGDLEEEIFSCDTCGCDVPESLIDIIIEEEG